MITSEQIERFISAAKEGRKTYAPMKCIIYGFEDGEKTKPVACITGAAAWGLGVDTHMVDAPLHERLAAKTVYAVAEDVLKALGVDPFQEVRDLDGNLEVLYRAIPLTYDGDDVGDDAVVTPADDEAFYAWLRGLAK